MTVLSQLTDFVCPRSHIWLQAFFSLTIVALFKRDLNNGTTRVVFTLCSPQRGLGGCPISASNRNTPFWQFSISVGVLLQITRGEMMLLLKSSELNDSPMGLPAFPLGPMTSRDLRFVQSKPEVCWVGNLAQHHKESLGLGLLKRPECWVFPQKQIPTGLPFPAKPTSHIRCPIPSHSPAYVPFL